jgi:hypothetical protein
MLPSKKVLVGALTPLLVFGLVLVASSWVANQKTLAAKEALFEACVNSGKNATWSSESIFVFTTVEFTCTAPGNPAR